VASAGEKSCAVRLRSILVGKRQSTCRNTSDRCGRADGEHPMGLLFLASGIRGIADWVFSKFRYINFCRRVNFMRQIV
jgi:hypothetical protein